VAVSLYSANSSSTQSTVWHFPDTATRNKTGHL